MTWFVLSLIADAAAAALVTLVVVNFIVFPIREKVRIKKDRCVRCGGKMPEKLQRRPICTFPVGGHMPCGTLVQLCWTCVKKDNWVVRCKVHRNVPTHLAKEFEDCRPRC